MDKSKVLFNSTINKSLTNFLKSDELENFRCSSEYDVVPEFDYTVEMASLESADSTTQGFGDLDSMVKRVKRWKDYRYIIQDGIKRSEDVGGRCCREGEGWYGHVKKGDKGEPARNITK
jgi:hypothetical protein